MWLRDLGSFLTVASALDMQLVGFPTRVLTKKLEAMKKALWKWNKTHFGFIWDRIGLLTSELDRVQQLASTSANMTLESSIKGTIREQLLWQQRLV